MAEYLEKVQWAVRPVTMNRYGENLGEELFFFPAHRMQQAVAARHPGETTHMVCVGNALISLQRT